MHLLLICLLMELNTKGPDYESGPCRNLGAVICNLLFDLFKAFLSSWANTNLIFTLQKRAVFHRTCSKLPINISTMIYVFFSIYIFFMVSWLAILPLPKYGSSDEFGRCNSNKLKDMLWVSLNLIWLFGYKLFNSGWNLGSGSGFQNMVDSGSKLG